LNPREIDIESCGWRATLASCTKPCALHHDSGKGLIAARRDAEPPRARGIKPLDGESSRRVGLLRQLDRGREHSTCHSEDLA
jgi:hypothetical protein